MKNILIIGELALHIFILDDREKYNEEIVQMGGVGYMVRKLKMLGQSVKCIAVCGDDSIAIEFKRKLEEVCSWYRLEKKKKYTSVVYIDMRNDAPKVNICKSDTDFTLDFSEVEENDIVYYPYFENYTKSLEGVMAKSNQVIVDFGYYRWAENSELLLNALDNVAQNGFVALVSGEKYNREEKIKIIEKLRSLNYENIIVTAADENILAWVNNQLNEISVSPVEAVCSTGAGDIFAVGLMCAIKEGKNMLDAIEYAKNLVVEKIKKMGV